MFSGSCFTSNLWLFYLYILNNHHWMGSRFERLYFKVWQRICCSISQFQNINKMAPHWIFFSRNKMDLAHRALDFFPCSANQEINLTWPNPNQAGLFEFLVRPGGGSLRHSGKSRDQHPKVKERKCNVDHNVKQL